MRNPEVALSPVTYSPSATIWCEAFFLNMRACSLSPCRRFKILFFLFDLHAAPCSQRPTTRHTDTQTTSMPSIALPRVDPACTRARWPLTHLNDSPWNTHIRWSPTPRQTHRGRDVRWMEGCASFFSMMFFLFNLFFRFFFLLLLMRLRFIPSPAIPPPVLWLPPISPIVNGTCVGSWPGSR